MSTIYTIGHSNRTIEAFMELLEVHNIKQIVDIRTIPMSRRLPWFNKQALQRKLSAHNIHYHHLPALGGLRKSIAYSTNTGWRNLSFRGFADYMQTMDFFHGLKELINLSKENHRKTAMMCAEAVPWRCHRSLVADAMLARHIRVLDIINTATPRQHQLTPFAVIDKSQKPIQIYYPSKNPTLDV